jgi:hypothetical protein
MTFILYFLYFYLLNKHFYQFNLNDLIFYNWNMLKFFMHMSIKYEFDEITNLLLHNGNNINFKLLFMQLCSPCWWICKVRNT